MKHISYTHFFVFLFVPLVGFSQKTTPKPTLPPKKIEKPKQIFPELNYFGTMALQNDMLVLHEKTDRYFSGGQEFHYHWRSEGGATVNIFPLVSDNSNFLGVRLVSNFYTPSSILNPLPQGDRPYAGTIYVGFQNISTNIDKKIRISAEYCLGFMGPATQQEQIQQFWHRVIDRPQPVGWGRQIKNDPIVQANFQVEKHLFSFENRLEIIGNLNGELGTLMNKMGGGVTARIGWLNNYWANPFNIKDLDFKKNIKAFVFFKPNLRVVIDNSLLQGGIINGESSPVTISKDDLKRHYFNVEYGYAVSVSRFLLSYSQQFRTAEFRAAKTMFWGNLTLSCGF